MKHALSQTQLGIYVTCLNSQEEGNYNLDMLYRLDEKVDTARLASALDKVIEAHPYVKSRLVTDENGDVMFDDLHCKEEFHTTVTEVGDIEKVRSSFGRDYDLLKDRLFRLEIYKTPKGSWLYVDFHHIIFDGMSWGIFRDDLARAYNGEDPEPEAVDGFKVAEDEIEARKSDAYNEAREWYRTEFGPADELESMPLPDKYGDDEEHFVKLWKKLDIDRKALAALCTKAGVTEATVYTAAFGYTLSKYICEEEVLYTSVYHGRTDKATRRSFCMMVKTLPVYQNFQRTPSVQEMLRQTADQIGNTRKHSVYSFPDAHLDLGINADVSFVYQGAFHDFGIVLDGRRQEETSLVTHTPGFKFLGMLMMENDEPYIWCEYQSNRFSAEFVEGFWNAYAHVVDEMCRKEQLSEIETSTPEQLKKLDSFNHEMPEADSNETVLSAFCKAAAQYPDNTAVIYGDRKMTYRELDEASTRIGAYIYGKTKDCGKKEPVVSILIGRSELMTVLPLAAMKAGCAYQPLDPSYPKERLNFMVKDADSVMLVADPDLRDIVSDYKGEVLLTTELEKIPAPSSKLPELLKPESLFILLYTSGSTGVPKGVMLEHQNLIAFCKWYHKYYDLKPEHRVAAYASFGFDADMMDLYPALTCGAAVVIVPEDKRLDLVALGEYFCKNGVTHSFITTQVGVQFLLNVEETGALKYLSVGGEKLVSVDPPKDYAFFNGYGPTECTIFSTTMPVLVNEPNIPIGKPTDELNCLVCDKHLHRLPVGAAGELVIVGAQVGRGYLNRPDKTAEAFFTLDGRRAYHSGDIVRYRDDGNIEFVGRRDGQVKIRGFRIELKEVEAVIREFPGIKDCTVQAFDDENGGKFIAAYVVSDDENFDVQALNEYILSQKPPYMVPAHTMRLDSIPLNVNQKVDRKALPKPEPEKKEHAAGAAPLNEMEIQLKEIISEIVKTDDFDITEPLGYLGLTSISSIRLAVLIFKKYGVQLDSKSLARTGTLQSIENEIIRFLLSGNKPAEPVQAEEKKPSRAPLSFTQQGVYTECMTNPDTVIYNMPMCLTFAPEVTAERIKDAVLKVLEAHPYMACHFVDDQSGEVVQEPIPGFSPEVQTLQMTEKEFSKYKAEFVRPFDLARGPMFRFDVVQVGKACSLLMDIHHLIGDGASVDMITHQICEALDGKQIEAEKYDYYSFVADQKLDATAEDYFDGTIAGVEEVSRLIPDIFTEDVEHRVGTVCTKVQAGGIDAFTKKNNITPASFFLAATALSVSRWLCDEDVSIASISNGRSNLLVSGTAGMFVNTLPLALHAGTKDGVADFIAQAASVLDNAVAHENYPFARVASKYGFMPSISYACQLGVLESLRTAEGEVKMESLELDVPKLPVAIYVNGSLDSGIELQVDYDSGLYTEALARHFAESIRNVALELLSAGSLSDISLTTADDWAQLDSFNPEFFTDYDFSDTAVSLFRKQVEAHPDKTAAVYKERKYTFRELDAITDRLAAEIYSKVSASTGKKNLAEEVVSIIIDRNEWVYLLPIAVLKTGCAYEPLDPSYPATRLNFMVQDAKAALLLGQPELVTLVNEYKGDVLLTTELEPLLDSKAGAKLPPVEVKPSDLMLMLYTSGSTGKPKGVQIEHSNIITFVNGVRKEGFYGEDSRVAAYASFGFDVCMMDIFCTLLNGGTLYVIPEDMRLELGILKEYLDNEEITQIFMTTQVGVQFLLNYPQMKTLRTLSMGGEKLPAVHPEGLSYRILNGYGPTENTCGVSQYVVEHWEPNIPLGKPMPTILGYILDKSGHRLPPGACGEYCVAGHQPARGYLGLPEKTAEVFVDLPDCLNPDGIPGLRLYHTGDIVRYRENGDVEFVGRKDGMVKIRGFRIELKEVEAAIRPFEGIQDVTVQAYDYETGGKYLAAFVVGKDGKAVDTDALLAFVKSQKPPYMVPSVVMQIDRIPLTVNQKVDKKALPKPQLAAAEYVAPKTKGEEDFCSIFGEVLGLEKVSADGNFFEIGGSSIIALKVVIAAGKRGYTIVYNDVFEYPTPQAMAGHLNADSAPVETAAPERPAEEGEGSVYGSGIREVDSEGYDYHAVNALLRGNTMEEFLSGERQPLGDVLLAGATGFLGIHVLKDLVDNYSNRIYCFIRSKEGQKASDRLNELFKYYFGTDCGDLIGSRIFIVEGDATDPKALDGFAPETSPFTVINCAASVKHFAQGNEIELVNVTSVRNLVTWCIRNKVRLVHVSTGSVMGVHVGPEIPAGFRFDEHMLYVGQTIDDNQYVHSKFMAERLIYDAVLHQGLNAKVMRVGNLAPRYDDGMFQINYKTNNFMATLSAYQFLGMIPYEAMDAIVEFSPIDKVARAILLLSETPQKCVCFMPSNHYRPHMGDIVMEFGSLGKNIRMVESDEFGKAVAAALEDTASMDRMRPFMAYSDKGPAKKPLGPDDLDVNYTVQVLYRLGFRWPKTEEEYVHRFLARLDGLGYFS